MKKRILNIRIIIFFMLLTLSSCNIVRINLYKGVEYLLFNSEKTSVFKYNFLKEFSLITNSPILGVSDLKADYLAYSDQITVKWGLFDKQTILKKNITSYRLYRADNPEMNDYKIIFDLKIESSKEIQDFFKYIDKDIVKDKNYYYSVKVITSATVSNDEKFSGIVIGRAGKLPIPKIKVSEGIGDSITLECLDTDIDYQSYDVYRRYEYYKPLYLPKERHSGDLTDNYPDNYDQKFLYRINPNRIKSSWTKIGSDVRTTIFTDDCVINQIYGQRKARGPVEYYIVLKNYDEKPQYSPRSEVKSGYRVLEDREFLEEFLATTDKLEYKLTNMHLKGTRPNKPEDVEGDYSGIVEYRTDLKLLQGKIHVLTYYKNYRDYFFILNDHVKKPQTTEVSFKANGAFVGGNNISGIYSGYVLLDIVIKDGKPCGGGYYVKNSSNPERFFDWDFNRYEIDKYLKILP
ncbi:MAG: hypothetical protein JXR63_04395 [Spirochaetales bacterium]|nr:hypothetical protein [Spirochaetales bacterium]